MHWIFYSKGYPVIGGTFQSSSCFPFQGTFFPLSLPLSPPGHRPRRFLAWRRFLWIGLLWHSCDVNRSAECVWNDTATAAGSRQPAQPHAPTPKPVKFHPSSENIYPQTTCYKATIPMKRKTFGRVPPERLPLYLYRTTYDVIPKFLSDVISSV